MTIYRRFIPILIIILALLSLSCERYFSPEKELKGEFKLLEVTPLPEKIDNILKNGSFNEWLSGVRVPSGFLPPFSQYSYVLKRNKKGSGYIVVQRWVADDSNAPIDNLFRITVDNLETNKKYLFKTKAVLLKGPQVNIGLWKISDPKRPEPYIVPLIEIKGEENKLLEVENPFTIDQSDAVYIFASYSSAEKPQIEWHEWILTTEP